MNVQNFVTAFEKMRLENLGKTYDRRELGLLALQYGIYFNSTMWASGLGSLFNSSKIGSKCIYSFKNNVTSVAAIEEISRNIREYKHNNQRTIEHAKNILRKFGIKRVD